MIYHNYNLLIKIYCNEYHKELICTSIKRKIFLLYNYEIKLWVEHHIDNIYKHFSENIYKLIEPLENYHQLELSRVKHYPKYLEYVNNVSINIT